MSDRDAIKAALIETLSSPEGAGWGLSLFHPNDTGNDGCYYIDGNLDLDHLTSDVEVRVDEARKDGIEEAAKLVERLSDIHLDKYEREAYLLLVASIRKLKEPRP